MQVLIPGCGNSTLGENLYDSGVVNITNIDISNVVISLMRDLCAAKDQMEFAVKDARNLSDFPENCFNLVIDKGLFDTQLCTQDNVANAQMLIKEMYRVLKPGGTYLMISHGSPDSRLGKYALPSNIICTCCLRPSSPPSPHLHIVRFGSVFLIF